MMLINSVTPESASIRRRASACISSLTGQAGVVSSIVTEARPPSPIHLRDESPYSQASSGESPWEPTCSKN